MPTALAAAKWPSSCRMISAAKPSEGEEPAHARTPAARRARRRRARASRRPRRGRRSARTGRRAARSSVRLDHRGDAEERAAARRGRRARRPRWRRSARTARCRPRAPASRARRRHGKVSASGGSKVSAPTSARSSGAHRHVDALGVVQRVGDRHAHVGVAEVRERGAVVQVDERVDDRLRVHDDVDPLVRRRRTGGGPRSARGPCSSASPSRS